MVGQNIGAGKIDRAEKSANLAGGLATVLMAVLGSLLFFLPHLFISIFTGQTEVITTGAVYLRYLSATFAFIAISIVFGRALNGAGDTVSPMVMTFICQLGIGLLLVILLSYLVGIKGVWIGIALSNVVQGVLMWLWFRRGTWKTKKLVGKK